MFLVTGATGNVGREVVRSLLDAGAAVRVLTRDRAHASGWGDRVEVVEGDLGKPETLAAPFRGVEGIFLLAGDDLDGVLHVQHAIAATAPGTRVVLLSSLGAKDPAVQLARSHAEREQRLAASGLPWTAVRPGTFMSNTAMWAQAIRAQGGVFNPYAQGRTAPIAPEDIGAVAAKALAEGQWLGQALELTGPEPLSTPEQVAILSRILGVPLKTIEITPEQAEAGMRKSGMPAPFASALRELTERVRAGSGGVTTDTVERVLGRKPMTFEAWARRHISLWRPTA